jgi:hypothetical protein
LNIQYIEPLSQGISRMKKALFHPFDLKQWFAIGFTAFLAGFTDSGFSSGAPRLSRRMRSDLESVLYFPQRAWEWLVSHPGWAIIILNLGLAVCIFGIILTWLSSRGKFMFLDNVVGGRSRVVAPWYEFRNEGNSLFWWNLLWGLIILAMVVAYLYYSIVGLQRIYEISRNGRALIRPAVLAGMGLIVLTAVTFYAYILLRDFVVPIMYRDRITTGKAIQKFLPLFSSQFLYFIGYGLFLFCLALLIAAGILIAGCLTCCIGFLFLAIPYINAVILLPVSYSLRAFSLEFLEQFGPEYHIFPRPDLNPPGGESIAL